LTFKKNKKIYIFLVILAVSISEDVALSHLNRFTTQAATPSHTHSYTDAETGYKVPPAHQEQ